MDMEDDIMECLETLDLDSYTAIWFENSLPDISIMEMANDAQMCMFVTKEFGKDGCIQTIINNMDPATRTMCPYFRVFMDAFGKNSPINFKLQSFYHRIGMGSLDARCNKALVVGLAALTNLNEGVSVPMAFCTTSIDPIAFHLEEIDMACLKPCGKAESSLCDIAGLCLPIHVPDDVQWRILSFLRSPEAEIIQDQIDDLCHRWDVFLAPMFHQREPRIPVPIASFFNVPTVQSTIYGAVRPFLAPIACPRTGSAQSPETS